MLTLSSFQHFRNALGFNKYEWKIKQMIRDTGIAWHIFCKESLNKEKGPRRQMILIGFKEF